MQIRCSPSWATAPNNQDAHTSRPTNRTRVCAAASHWWAWQDLNLWPHAYQACALTNWATGPDASNTYKVSVFKELPRPAVAGSGEGSDDLQKQTWIVNKNFPLPPYISGQIRLAFGWEEIKVYNNMDLGLDLEWSKRAKRSVLSRALPWYLPSRGSISDPLVHKRRKMRAFGPELGPDRPREPFGLWILGLDPGFRRTKSAAGGIGGLPLRDYR